MQQEGIRAERNAKAAAYKRERRRRLLIRQAFGSLRLEAFSPSELFRLIAGSSREARLTLTRSRRRNRAPAFAKITRGECGPSALLRPNRVLSRLNRSSVFPPIVSNDQRIEQLAALNILAALHESRNIHPPHRLLDQLAVASGFRWETCADLLYSRRLVDETIAHHVVEVTRQARSFWNRFQQGQARYARLVAKAQTPGLGGDWAFFEASEFEHLLPGIVIPTRLRRQEYLTRWVAESAPFSLDVYAGLDGAALFRHPFPEQFNPLSFGQLRPDNTLFDNGRN
jgi:hypothetical protein